MRLLTVFTLLSSIAFGQNENDLFRYSMTSFQGTARYEGMCGSFGALGADLSSSQINPAGYGRYSSSQAGLSLYGGTSKNSALFNGETTGSNSGMGGLSNFAIVLTEDVSERSSGFLFSQIGFGVNRVENFKNKIEYKGQQFESLLDTYTGQATGFYPEELNTFFPFSTSLAWETYMINFDPSSVSYYSLLSPGNMFHERTVTTKGGITELFFSYSANYMNKLYIGANLGVRFMRYEEDFVHQETLLDTSGTDLRSFEYTYNLRTEGNGSNLKIGAIYLISESLRLGLALHTPTFTELEDNWTANMTARFEDSTKYVPESLIPTGNYKYRLRNPGRIIGSIAYVFGTRGCVNLDIEYLNYDHAHFKSTRDMSYQSYSYAEENVYADQLFTDALNLRIGGEIVLNSIFFVRGGFAYYGSAFDKNQAGSVSPDLFISGGVGMRMKNFNLDLAYKQRMNSRNYYAFTNSFAEITNNTGLFTLSGSLYF